MKEIVGVVLDGTAFKDDTPSLSQATTRASMILHRAATEARSSDMSGLVLVGTKHSQNPLGLPNVNLWGPFSKRSVERLAEWQRGLVGVEWGGEGDLLDGVVQCGDAMVEAVAGGKFTEAVIYVISTSERVKEMQAIDADGCKEVGERLEAEGMEVFFVTDTSVDLVFGEQLNTTHFDATFSHPIKRVRPTTLFRGDMAIGTTLRIPVKMYNKTLVASVPRGKWCGQRATGHYHRATDELVTDERMVKAYKYGTDRIPFSLLDQVYVDGDTGGDQMCRKGLSVIGFGLQSKLCRSAFLGTVMVIVADHDHDQDHCFMALVMAMEKRDRVGIARFCRTEKAEPRLLYLIPNTFGQCIYAVTAPFAEDHRRWTFPSLPVVGDGGLAAVSRLIDTLYVDDDDDNIRNPTIHHLWSVIRLRAINGDNHDVPAVSVDLISALNSRLPSTSQTVHDLTNNLQQHLPVVANPTSDTAWHRTSAADAMPRFWSAATVKGAELAVDELLNTFNRLVNDSTEDRTGEAMLMLMTRIPQILYTGTGDSDTDQRIQEATRCLRRLRLAATQHAASTRYNAFISELKRRATHHDHLARLLFGRAVVGERLGLISGCEDEQSAVTPDEARDFMLIDP